MPPMEIRGIRDSASGVISPARRLCRGIVAVGALTFVRADRINNADTNKCLQWKRRDVRARRFITRLAAPFFRWQSKLGTFWNAKQSENRSLNASRWRAAVSPRPVALYLFSRPQQPALLMLPYRPHATNSTADYRHVGNVREIRRKEVRLYVDNMNALHFSGIKSRIFANIKAK